MASSKESSEYSWISTASSISETSTDSEKDICNAALNEEYDRVKKMLDEGMNPSLPDNQGFTALHYAARSRNLSLLTLLLEKGADVNAKTRGGATALHMAAFFDYTEIVIMLLESGADPAMKDNGGKTSFHKAVEGSCFEIGRLLLRKNRELINMKDNNDKLPKFYAATTHVDYYDAAFNLED